MVFLKAFLVGGAICMVGQILIDTTKLTPARILTSFVVAGVVLSALGLYGPLVKFAGAGATVPIVGFGHTLFEGVKQALAESGALGMLTGGLSAASGGIAASLLVGLVIALVFKSKDQS
ncbi:MAG: stage V sporulation protein AE [Oscillospiraceae bacterium]